MPQGLPLGRKELLPRWLTPTVVGRRLLFISLWVPRVSRSLVCVLSARQSPLTKRVIQERTNNKPQLCSLFFSICLSLPFPSLPFPFLLQPFLPPCLFCDRISLAAQAGFELATLLHQPTHLPQVLGLQMCSGTPSPHSPFCHAPFIRSELWVWPRLIWGQLGSVCWEASEGTS